MRFRHLSGKAKRADLVVSSDNDGVSLYDDSRPSLDLGLVCWRNVPIEVWEYTISGYPAIKKWLSYREKQLSGEA